MGEGFPYILLRNSVFSAYSEVTFLNHVNHKTKVCTKCIDRYSPRMELPLDDVCYRATVYTLSRVQSGTIIYKSVQTIHKLVSYFSKKGNLKDDHDYRQLSENRTIYGNLSATDLFANALSGFIFPARGQTDRDIHSDPYTHLKALGIIITTE